MTEIALNSALYKYGTRPTFGAPVSTEIQGTNEAAWKTAQEFEAAFIAQMLQFSGLADALVSNGGKEVESFTQFYLEEMAQDIVDNGGFGIAEKIYTHMIQKEEDHGELGRL